jgi:hypothetical protein
MNVRISHIGGRFGTALAIVAGAVLLRVVAGVGFANYDTLYALAWGGQLARGQTPAYGVAIAPTPHPLVEALGFSLQPLGPSAVANIAVWLGFLALSGCGWVIYSLGADWFGRAAGALAALIFLTRVPVLSYGVRAYIDVPYLLLVLGALLVESRRPRAGAPVLALLALAGLLRPEAWVFSGLYWLYVMQLTPRRARAWLRARTDSAAIEHAPVAKSAPVQSAPPRPTPSDAPPRSGGARPEGFRSIALLTLLATVAPLIWLISDLAITGDLFWSLTNTRATARTLDRVTGIANVPEYIPRRIGEVLSPPVLVGAALGGVLSLLWLRRRALIGALAGFVSVLVFAAFATVGLPINTRYAFLASAILCIFCGAGVFGWMLLEREDPHRTWWTAGGMLVLVALLAYVPSQYRLAHRELNNLARQQRIQNDLVALVDKRSITLRCGPVGVPNHAPIPLLALYLKTSPANIVSAQVHQISIGEYADPATREVETTYILDPHDPHLPVRVPPGFTESASNRSWVIFKRCG